MEPRTTARVEFHVRKADGSSLGEILFTENISRGGAGFLSGSSWKPGEKVLLKALRLNFTAEGEIAYCRRTNHRKFAVGVSVTSPKGKWPG